MTQQVKQAFHLRGLTLVLVAGAWLAGICLNKFVELPPLILFTGAGAVLLLLIPLWHDRQRRLALLLISCLLLGAGRYALASPLHNPQAISHFISDKSIKIHGTVSDEPRLWGRSRLLIISVSRISLDDGESWQEVHGKIAVPTQENELITPYGANYGSNVELQGKLQPSTVYHPSDTFTSMDFARIAVTGEGGNPAIAFLYQLRFKMARGIEQSLPQPLAALLVGISFSMYRPGLGELKEHFQNTGAAHMLSASGSNVVILAGLLKQLFRVQEPPSYPISPGSLPPHRTRRQWLSTTCVVIGIIAYMFLCGAGPAVIRASIMGILLVIAPRIGRIYNIYTALAFTALLMSMLDPLVVWNVSFQLSFAGTLGIVLLTPYFQRWLRPLVFSSIIEILAITLSAQTASQPIFAVTFHKISLVSPIVNILTVPLFALMLLLGIIISGMNLIATQLGILCGWAALPVLWYVATIVTWFGNLPGAYIEVTNFSAIFVWTYYTILTLVLIIAHRMQKVISLTPLLAEDVPLPGWNSRIWRVVLPALALLVILSTAGLALFSPPHGRLTITFLRVGPAKQIPQGQAILVRTPDNQTVLIDGGPDVATLAQELDSRLPAWQRTLDAAVLTTARTEHITGLQDIISRYYIKAVIDAGMMHPNTTYTLWRRTISERNLNYVSVAQGTTIPIGSQVRLEILWPVKPLHNGSDEERDNGLVLRLVTSGLSVLFLGATAQSKHALTGLLSQLDAHYLQADIVQIIGDSKPYPPLLGEVLQKANPSLLIITPARLSVKQRQMLRENSLAPSMAAQPGAGTAHWQVIETAQSGTVEIISGDGAWNMNIL